jgi:hypothetical protein
MDHEEIADGTRYASGKVGGVMHERFSAYALQPDGTSAATRCVFNSKAEGYSNQQLATVRRADGQRLARRRAALPDALTRAMADCSLPVIRDPGNYTARLRQSASLAKVLGETAE